MSKRVELRSSQGRKLWPGHEPAKRYWLAIVDEGNNKVLASSETYDSRFNARRAAEVNFPEYPLVDNT